MTKGVTLIWMSKTIIFPFPCFLESVRPTLQSWKFLLPIGPAFTQHIVQFQPQVLGFYSLIKKVTLFIK